MGNYILDDLEIFYRILGALLAGGLIGFERERKGKAAGFVTNVLVCVGSASIAIIQCLIIQDILTNEGLSILKSDPSRLTAQIVSGVGFLGAGAILHEKGGVKGITTAATIWVVASIGIAFGMGYYKLGILVTLTVYFSIMLLKKFELYFLTSKVRKSFYIEYRNSGIFEEKLELFLSNKAIRIRNFHYLEEFEKDENSITRATIELIAPRYLDIDILAKDISLMDEVQKFKKIRSAKYKINL